MPCDRTRKDDVRECARSVMCDVRCLCNTACMISENHQPHRCQPSLACFPPAMHLSYSIRCLKITTDQKPEALSLSESHPRYSAVRILSSPDRCALCFFLRISHKLFHYTVQLSHFTCSGFLPGVVGIAFGLNRAAVTNNSEVMRDHRAIPFPWALPLPALRQRVIECTA